MMRELNVSHYVSYELSGDSVRFYAGDVSTGFMSKDDPFVERISNENINRRFPSEHLIKEIEMKNLLDEGMRFLNSKKASKAIGCFDEVLFYDPCHIEALLGKSHGLFLQKHFVKALRHYKKALKAGFEGDAEYHKTLLAESSRERDSFPKIKASIYAGDEYFSRGDWANALKSYEKALADTSKFKDKILFKLLNKKATTLVKLNEFKSAIECFNESLNALNNDYACFARGVCEHMLERPLSECFFNELKITKKQILAKADILNDIGENKKALKCYDFLLKNHFRNDEMYKKILKGKRNALSDMGLSTGEVDELLKEIP